LAFSTGLTTLYFGSVYGAGLVTLRCLADVPPMLLITAGRPVSPGHLECTRVLSALYFACLASGLYWFGASCMKSFTKLKLFRGGIIRPPHPPVLTSRVQYELSLEALEGALASWATSARCTLLVWLSTSQRASADVTRWVDVQLSRVTCGSANGGLPPTAWLLPSVISGLHVPSTVNSLLRHTLPLV
jgi:hypothetical protein